MARQRAHTRATVQIYTEAIDAEFGPGGQVTTENKKIREKVIIRATKKAPRRSGNLKFSHRDGGALKEGKYRLRGEVYNDSDHAAYVHDGTTSPIFPKRGKAMPIPTMIRGRAKRDGAPPGFLFPVGPSFPKKWVRGQRAQPWLLEAAEEVLSGY